jgi:hypothetical protein
MLLPYDPPAMELRARSHPRWPGLTMIAGGALMIVLWPFYTRLHGPTSVDEQGALLGQGTEFWGGMMEGPSLLLIALGLAGSYAPLTGQGGRKARVGFVLALIALSIPALVNLATLSVWPPLLAPVLGIGLVLIAAGNRALPGLIGVVLVALALLAFFAFLWLALVRPDVLDRIDGYRIYGIGANVLFGLGWVLLGASLLRRGNTSAVQEQA